MRKRYARVAGLLTMAVAFGVMAAQLQKAPAAVANYPDYECVLIACDKRLPNPDEFGCKLTSTSKWTICSEKKGANCMADDASAKKCTGVDAADPMVTCATWFYDCDPNAQPPLPPPVLPPPGKPEEET